MLWEGGGGGRWGVVGGADNGVLYEKNCERYVAKVASII